MFQEVSRTDLQNQTQQLLDGPLKHIRAAALAAALLPLASVAVAHVSAQTFCGSGGVCGVVFNDANNNGIQDAGDTGIEGAKITVCQLCDGTDNVESESGVGGFFEVFVSGGSTTIAVLIPTGTQASPPNAGSDDGIDSDGVPNGGGFSVVTLPDIGPATDFGFFTPSVTAALGTGTPGYWKNHPEAWPVGTVTVGGVTYTKEQAITWLGRVGKDKTTTMFSSLVSATLNVNPLVGNKNCVAATIAAADAWLTTYPLGSGVTGSSAAWKTGEPLHQTLDAYNNGLLCAPHRN